MKNKNLFEAVATLVGFVVGAGILGLPFVFSRAGFWTGVLNVIVIGAAVLVLNLMLGEISLRTKQSHQLSGYASKYLGHKWKKNGLLFLDEMNTAPTSVQIAAYQLMLDRKIGNYEFPDGWRIIAAGNRETDKAFVTKMPSPLANRLIHIDTSAEIEDWKLWAHGKVDPRVIAFLSFRPKLLCALPKEEVKAYPTPRSWQFVSDTLKLYKNDIHEADVVFEGTVGKGATKEFYAFLDIYQDLPDVDKILAGKDRTIPKKTDVLYALISVVVTKLNKSNLENFLKYTMKMSPEFATLAVRDAARGGMVKQIQATKSWKKWADKFGEFL